MKALIDADSLLYKVGFAIEEKVIWNEPEYEAGLEEPEIDYFTDLNQCSKTLDQLIDNILFATDCDSALLVFTGADNFRYDNPLGYKEHRTGARKPTGYEEILAYAKTYYTTETVEGMEADDFVVWLKTEEPEDWILCAIDKDVLYQTEGTHYNYNRDEEVTVTAEEAVRYAYYQTLVGDTSDGYKGCPGIGPKKADKILDECETEQEMWDAVVEAFDKKKLCIDHATNMMRLANMHQYNGNEVILWTPESLVP